MKKQICTRCFQLREVNKQIGYAERLRREQEKMKSGDILAWIDGNIASLEGIREATAKQPCGCADIPEQSRLVIRV